MTSISGKYHFTGVGGVGMSPLARLTLGCGGQVSGSDRAFDQGHLLPVVQKLKGLGVELVAQDGSGVTAQTKAMVVSTAIEDDNPEVLKANELKVPLIHRARLLADLSEGHRIIAVAGTAGKTTVTGMLGWVLDALGADPCVVNGGAILNWVTESEPGSVHLPDSHDGPWVLEVDESDKSFLNFFPDSAIITNVSEDHFSLAEVEAMFDTFRGQVKGVVIEGDQEWESVGILAEASRTGSVFTYKDVVYELTIPGLHNARNAFAVVRLCEELGYNLLDIQEPLASFKGIERRLDSTVLFIPQVVQLLWGLLMEAYG